MKMNRQIRLVDGEKMPSGIYSVEKSDENELRFKDIKLDRLVGVMDLKYAFRDSRSLSEATSERIEAISVYNDRKNRFDEEAQPLLHIAVTYKVVGWDGAMHDGKRFCRDQRATLVFDKNLENCVVENALNVFYDTIGPLPRQRASYFLPK
jgi:hypothetical protein